MKKNETAVFRVKTEQNGKLKLPRLSIYLILSLLYNSYYYQFCDFFFNYVDLEDNFSYVLI